MSLLRHLPNLICVLRMALIWPILASLQAGNYQLTLALFLVAAVSDGADGFLAKRFGWTSELGRVLDPAADKLLLVSLFLVGTWLGLIPRWLCVAAVTRDFMIGLGAIVYRLIWGRIHGRPMLISKFNTLLQLLFLLVVIVRAAYGEPPASVQSALAVMTLITIVLSGGAYVRLSAQRALGVVG
ncbi:MAG: CDP-alcohol phosphatidyltransferase family protein [Steroidobacteraceae bacterium]